MITNVVANPNTGHNLAQGTPLTAEPNSYISAGATGSGTLVLNLPDYTSLPIGTFVTVQHLTAGIPGGSTYQVRELTVNAHTGQLINIGTAAYSSTTAGLITFTYSGNTTYGWGVGKITY